MTKDSNSIFQRMRKNIYFFTGSMIIETLLFASMRFYNLGIMRMLERRFNFRNVETGFLNGIEDVSTVVVILFIGYLGKIFSKPKLIGYFMIPVSLGYFMFSLPYFIEGPKYKGLLSKNLTYDEYNNGSKYDFCKTSLFSIEDECSDSKEWANRWAFSIFVMANLLMGIGDSALFTLGTSYIYENSTIKQASYLLGAVFLNFTIAPAFAFPIASVLSKIPENLIRSPFEPSDQRFIGAWWLGYVVLSAALFIATLSFFFFPKYIRPFDPKKDSLNPKLAKLLSTKSVSSLMKFKAVASDIPRSFWLIFKNVPLIAFILANCFTMFGSIGYFFTTTRYFEKHFKLKIHQANFLLGIIMVIPGVTGSILSSILSRFVRRRKAVAVCALTTFISVVLLIVLMQISCSQTDMNGITGKEIKEGCSTGCNCNDMSFEPVCDSEGINYFSPCAAGCNTSYTNQTFTNCKCALGGTVTKKLCSTPCSKISLYTYVAIFILFVLANILNKVPAGIIRLR